MATGEGRPGKITPTTSPITLTPTAISHTFAHVHPCLLLSFYYIQFPSLVADPISTLWTSLLPITLLQIGYAITCLPPYQASAPPNTKVVRPGSRKRAADASQSSSTKAITAFLALVLTAIPATPIITVALILFGAPLTTHHAQTALCAAHMALLAGFPLTYVHGVSTAAWREIVAAMLPFDDVWGGTIGCLLGAWLGAVPIPLDWYVDHSGTMHVFNQSILQGSRMAKVASHNHHWRFTGLCAWDFCWQISFQRQTD